MESWHYGMAASKIRFSLLLALAASAASPAEPPRDEICLSCHQGAVASNPKSPHLQPPPRCASCHGDGSKHAGTGDPKLIRSFKGKPAADVCVTCHQEQHVAEWKASRHAQVGVDCIDCHAIHVMKNPKDSCKSCH
jgi:hypothetical protein